jgi:iron complex transport system permease protein
VHLTWNELWALVTGGDAGLAGRVILELRLPRSMSAFAVGGLLALAGALMQVLLRNPLADPYVLGVSGGAAVGALGAMLLGLPRIWLTTWALVGALLSFALVFGLAGGRLVFSKGGFSPERLLLTGAVIASGWSAMVSVILAVSPVPHLPGMLFWLMGDLSRVSSPAAALAVLAGGLLLSWPLARSLNLLARGDLEAAALGVSVSPLRLQLYLVASALTATAVTAAGSIGFLGLVVPHAWRLLAGYDHRLLLPAAVLMGGSVLVLADTLARSLFAPQQLPVGALTALLGIPVFLYLLRRSR